MTLSATTEWATTESFYTEDEVESASSQRKASDIEAFYYDGSFAGSQVPTAANIRASQLFPLSKHSQFTLHTPLPTTTGYVDPFIAVQEMLWLLPGINDIVSNTLDRMEKAFAYNSVYFLKVILDLQVLYIPTKPTLPPEAILDENHILRIAGVLSGRLTRKESDSASPSRELQLRTLISALSLLYQLKVEGLNSDVYAKLLRDVTKRDAENEAKQANGGPDSFRTGENEFLTRYACDLIRGLPSDLPTFKDLNQEAIHFIFAAGFVNQLEDLPSKKTIDAVFARITASPSPWHKEMRHLYEETTGVISSHHQSKSSNPSDAGTLAGDIARTIIEKLKEQLQAFDNIRYDVSNSASFEGSDGILSIWDAQMFVCGLLDLLSQLVSAFPTSENIVENAKALALDLIRNSDKRAFRYKAFEIIICSTLGVGEREYYDTMRNLDLEIEYTSRPIGDVDTRTEKQKLESRNRVEQLKIEKREAMDHCEKKNVLSTGAAESIQRRLQGGSSVGKAPVSFDEIIHIKTPWSNEVERTSSPVPSSLPSQVPTLSSVGQSWETVSSDNLTPTPTCDQSILVSPTDTTTCKSPTSPTDTWQTILSPTSEHGFPDESPVLPLDSPHSPRKFPDATTSNADDDVFIYRDTSQLYPSGISLFEEHKYYDDYRRHSRHSRHSSLSDIPIRKPVPNRHASQSAIDLPLRSRSSETLESFASDSANQVLTEMSPVSIYPEPSLSRTSSKQTVPGTIRRQSRVSRSKRSWSLQLDKPLPPLADAGPATASIMDRNAPGTFVGPARSHSATGVREDKPRSRTAYGFRTPQQPRFTPLPPIADIGIEYVSGPVGPFADYEVTPIEKAYKFHSKDSCFSTYISADAKHAVFLSPHSFQAFAIPSPDQTPQLKPKFQYRLGEWEGLKKSKVSWQYKAAAVSERYVVAITKERLQVHDLADECNVIYNDLIKGWEYSTVDIAANKLVVGLSKALKGEDIGMVRIYRMNSHTYDGHRYERCGKDIHLPIHPKQPQDAPKILTLSKDGNYVTCATPRFGYYFIWDISRPDEPKLLSSSQLKRFSGPSGEALTGVTLFPDSKHLLISTFPLHNTKSPLGGSYTESIKNGNIWITPVTYLDDDDNLTTFAFVKSVERLAVQNFPDAAGGKIAFSCQGERLVCVDRKGKLLVLVFPFRSVSTPPPPPPPPLPQAQLPELSPNSTPEWAVKSEVGGYY
ncbi:hypothetical protein BDD12DRAFT_888648 [Trichophaea hybrida]|nr:hypothetical protein BDD12DRAFT_888648 [Trichophaea hybrida]